MEFLLIVMLLANIYGLYKVFEKLGKKPDKIEGLEHDVKSQNFVYRTLIEKYKMVSSKSGNKAVLALFEDVVNAKSHDSRQEMLEIARDVVRI